MDSEIMTIKSKIIKLEHERDKLVERRKNECDFSEKNYISYLEDSLSSEIRGMKKACKLLNIKYD